jgi:hypothetical protein
MNTAVEDIRALIVRAETAIGLALKELLDETKASRVALNVMVGPRYTDNILSIRTEGETYSLVVDVEVTL